MPATRTLAYIVATLSATAWMVALVLTGLRGFKRPALRWILTGLFVVSELLGAAFVVAQVGQGPLQTGLKLTGLVGAPVLGAAAVALVFRRGMATRRGA